MKIAHFIVFLFLLTGSTKIFAQNSTTLFIHNIENFEINKKKIEQGDKDLLKAKDRVLKEADKILKTDKSYSVTFKKELPPSDDLHDFYSMARYWWPNPKTKDGLPFVRKDGKPYPGRKDAPDSEMLSDLGADTYILGLAYYFTGKESYAKQIKKLVDVFFLDNETKMNPNFEYAQVIQGKGNSDGSIVSANPLMDVVEAIQLTQTSGVWSKQDYRKLQKWYKDFLNWMLNSKIGKKQRKAKNNIGTYYTTQAITYALFTGQEKLAREIAMKDGHKRITDQIDSNGAMSQELKRADPWGYIKYNLDAFKYLVEVAAKADVDLWKDSTSENASIKKAYEWLVPYALGEKEWNYGKKKVQSKAFKKFLKSSGHFPMNNYFKTTDDVTVYYQNALENAN